MPKIDRARALPYVSYVLDDRQILPMPYSLNAVKYNEGMTPLKPDAILVGWQCGFEPLFVAVQSYLPGTTIDLDEAAEIATDYLTEIGWFHGVPSEPDYIIN